MRGILDSFRKFFGQNSLVTCAVRVADAFLFEKRSCFIDCKVVVRLVSLG